MTVKNVDETESIREDCCYTKGTWKRLLRRLLQTRYTKRFIQSYVKCLVGSQYLFIAL